MTAARNGCWPTSIRPPATRASSASPARRARASRRSSRRWRSTTARRRRRSASSPSIPLRPSPAARSSATASAWPTSTPTAASSSAPWPRADSSADWRKATNDVVDLLDAAGFDIVLVETVGVGQDEVEIIRTVQTNVVVLVPGMGDDIQAIKAGIMEIGDVFVVNKADRPGADQHRHRDHDDDVAGRRARRLDSADREDGRVDESGHRRARRGDREALRVPRRRPASSIAAIASACASASRRC